MGGRGTFAAGNNVSYTYKTVGYIDGIKVLQPIDSRQSFSMPAEAHSSSSYIVLNKTGVFRQYMEYNRDRLPVFEIGYHFESGLSKAGKPVLHVHEYKASGIENLGKARCITNSEINKYHTLFQGVH